MTFERWLGSVAARAIKIQRTIPLGVEDIEFLVSLKKRRRGNCVLAVVSILIENKQPRWLLGWRDITNTTNERTVISSVLPHCGVGDKYLLIHFKDISCRLNVSILIASLSSLVIDYECRQRLGGTSLKYFSFKQIPIPRIDEFSEADRIFISDCILKLSYTSYSVREFARDLDFQGPPFQLSPEQRTSVRADLDAFLAIKCGLNRNHLHYILDPSDSLGHPYPSVTFPTLKRNEQRKFGEYRTKKQVLGAYDRLVGG